MKVRDRGNCMMTLYENVSGRQTSHARLLSIKAQWNGTKKMALITIIKNNVITLTRILMCAKGVCHSHSKAPEAQVRFTTAHTYPSDYRTSWK